VTKQPLGSVLLLSDFAGSLIDCDAIRTMKECAVVDKPYIKKSALIGAETFPPHFYDELKAFAGRELPMLRTRSDALNWLVTASWDRTPTHAAKTAERQQAWHELIH